MQTEDKNPRCPGCGSVVPVQPAAQGTRRRVVRFVECGGCDFIVRVSTYEGWDRWYALDGWPRDSTPHGHVASQEKGAFHRRAIGMLDGVGDEQ